MTQSVYLASYTGTHSGLAGIVNIGIRTLDRSIYSHTELCIGNPLVSAAKCYSSSGVDHGVRMKVMQLNPEKWDVLHLPFVNADTVTKHFAETDGAGYDYLGVGRFALPFLLREHKTRWFCDEWCLAALGVKEPWRFSPGGAHQIAIAMGGLLPQGCVVTPENLTMIAQGRDA